MTEATLTQDLMSRIKVYMRGAEPMKHADKFNGGYPDLSNTWRYVTSWWEIKFYDDRMFKKPVLQQIQCKKLALQGICYYIIYERRGLQKCTYIVRPHELDAWDESELVTHGLDHTWVAHFIRQEHLEYAPQRLGA